MPSPTSKFAAKDAIVGAEVESQRIWKQLFSGDQVKRHRGLRQIIELKLAVVKPNVDVNLRDVVEAPT